MIKLLIQGDLLTGPPLFGTKMKKRLTSQPEALSDKGFHGTEAAVASMAFFHFGTDMGGLKKSPCMNQPQEAVGPEGVSPPDFEFVKGCCQGSCRGSCQTSCQGPCQDSCHDGCGGQWRRWRRWRRRSCQRRS